MDEGRKGVIGLMNCDPDEPSTCKPLTICSAVHKEVHARRVDRGEHSVGGENHGED